MWCKMFDYWLGERSFGYCTFPDVYCFKDQLCLRLLVEGRYNSSMGLINKITHFTRPQQTIQIMYPMSVPVLLKLVSQVWLNFADSISLDVTTLVGRTVKYIYIFFFARKIIFKRLLLAPRKHAEYRQKVHSVNI